MKHAIVHEWFDVRGGSEKVVEQMLTVLPDAELFALVDFLDASDRKHLDRHVETSLLQRLPFARTRFRNFLPLMPFAIERFDLSAFDIVVSSNHAVAKGVLTTAEQMHVSYVHTPMRYAWDLHAQYLDQTAQATGVRRVGIQMIMHYLRMWDLTAASRVDHYLANSDYVARRIRKTYRRDADVLYPPVDTERFSPAAQRDDFYLVVGRLVPYKRVDVVVEAFNELRRPLVVVGDGVQMSSLRDRAGDLVTFLGVQPDDVVTDLLGRCKAFVFAAEEDFGITTVEAQAAGAPVVAFGRGGSQEIVLAGRTGLFFDDQTAAALIEAVEQFESMRWSTDQIVDNAARFGADRFRREFEHHLARRWEAFGGARASD